MATGLFLLLCLIGHVFAKEPPDVECIGIHLQSIHCTWNNKGTPDVNYTFYSWSNTNKTRIECTHYLLEGHTNIGCDRAVDKIFHIQDYYTVLVHGDKIYPPKTHSRDKVKLNPPTNLTVKNGSDSNLWFYWNQTHSSCVESVVRQRVNNREWEETPYGTGKQNHCINLPSSTSRYEVQVKSKLGRDCVESRLWSDWSDPVVWGSNNSTDANPVDASMSVWTPVLYGVGAITLVLLVVMLLHRERIRVLIIPVVPKPSPYIHDIENLCLKENFRADYSERACPVREYCPVSQSDSESCDSSTFSVTTDQTDCSVFVPADKSDQSTHT